MAVIKAVSSKAGIGHAIDYVTKKEKTEEKLVSGLHCEPETVKEEMQATKELWGKTDGRTYKHYVQSYHEDEKITPEQAHKNAVELAEHTKAWKGHEVLIAPLRCEARLYHLMARSRDGTDTTVPYRLSVSAPPSLLFVSRSPILSASQSYPAGNAYPVRLHAS